MKRGKLVSLSESLDFDIQTVSIELDTSAMRLRYYCLKDAADGIEVEKFNRLFDNIRENENFVFNINDNTAIYELKESNNVVVLYEDLTDKFIIFDKENSREVESMMLKKN